MDGEKEGVGSTGDLSSEKSYHNLPKAEKDVGKWCVILDTSRRGSA